MAGGHLLATECDAGSRVRSSTFRFYQGSPFTKSVFVAIVVNTVVKTFHSWPWSCTSVHEMAPGAPCGERSRAQSLTFADVVNGAHELLHKAVGIGERVDEKSMKGAPFSSQYS